MDWRGTNSDWFIIDKDMNGLNRTLYLGNGGFLRYRPSALYPETIGVSSDSFTIGMGSDETDAIALRFGESGHEISARWGWFFLSHDLHGQDAVFNRLYGDDGQFYKINTGSLSCEQESVYMISPVARGIFTGWSSNCFDESPRCYFYTYNEYTYDRGGFPLLIDNPTMGSQVVITKIEFKYSTEDVEPPYDELICNFVIYAVVDGEMIPTLLDSTCYRSDFAGSVQTDTVFEGAYYLNENHCYYLSADMYNKVYYNTRVYWIKVYYKTV